MDLPASALHYQKTDHIQHIFHKLAAVTADKKTIDKDTFLLYCGFPGDLGKKLFQIFDAKKTNELDKDEFFDAMKRLRFTEPRAKLDILFKLFDVDGKGIERNELHAILICIVTPPNVYLFSPESPDIDVKSEDNIENKRAERTKWMVDNAFSKYDINKSGKLEKEEFKTWIENTPKIKKYCDELFAQLARNGPQIFDNLYIGDTDVSITPGGDYAKTWELQVGGNTIFGNKKKRYIVLYNKFLWVYKDENIVERVDFIAGYKIKFEEKKSLITLIPPDDGRIKLYLYGDKDDKDNDNDKWYQALDKASQQKWKTFVDLDHNDEKEEAQSNLRIYVMVGVLMVAIIAFFMYNKQRKKRM